MLQSDQVEDLVCLISSLDRHALVHQLLEFAGDFPVDFTPSFLDGQDVERLRHLLFALCMQCQHIPDVAVAMLG